MKKIVSYLLNVNDSSKYDDYTNGSVNGIYLTEYSYYDKKSKAFEDSILKNICKIDKSIIKDKSFYRYPDLTLPRQKIDILKEKYNISITRKKDKADYKIISLKYLHSKIIKDSWYDLYKASDIIKAIKNKSNFFTASLVTTLIDSLDALDSETLVSINCNSYNSAININDLFANIEKVASRYYYVPDPQVSEFNELLSSANVLLDGQLNDVIYDGLHVLTKEEYNNSRSLIKSDDRENRSLALELLANCNLNKSFDYVSMLYYFYYDYLKDSNNWTNVNVKTLRESLSEFTPCYNNNNGRYYGNYLKKLKEADQLTEFAFKECARYAYHNVLKKSMGLDEDSVFEVNLDSIKLNKKYIGQLKED
jgi:hypothetical protein